MKNEIEYLLKKLKINEDLKTFYAGEKYKIMKNVINLIENLKKQNEARCKQTALFETEQKELF